MRTAVLFGEVKMKKLKLLFLAILVIVNCAFYANCQTKEEKVIAALQQCQALMDQDDIISAGDCYKNAIIANPDNVAQISQAGTEAFDSKCPELLDKKKKYEQATICFEALKILKPENSGVYLNLADSYYKNGKTEKDAESLDRAEKAIKKSIELRDESAIAHNIYARILEEKRQFREAIGEHRKAIELKPDYYLYWLDLGILQDKLNQNDDAIISFDKVLELKPDYDLPLYYLGNLYYRKGDIDKSIEIFEKLFEMSPEFEEEGGEQLEKIKRERDIKNKSKAKVKTVGGE